MSHELRTPLNAIMGMTGLALRQAADPKQADFLSKAMKASQHLLALISDILDISRIEADRMPIEERDFSLPLLLDEVLRMHDEGARGKGLVLRAEVAPDVPPELRGDALRLRQILLNFVGNAIKFSERGCIRLRVGLVEEVGGSVLLRLEVADEGIGLTREQAAKLFKPFSQVDDSLTRKYGGSGLGLVISRRIAELMGGEVGVDSEPGKGSCFWATVRQRRSGGYQPVLYAVDGESARDVLARDHRGKRILVVEDEPSNREVAASLLLDAGLVPELAVDGRGALDRARTGKFSMILMDLQMPVMNGLDAAQEIRRLPGMQRIPIVAMTANAFDADRQRCIDAGMNDHLRKPVLPEELYDRVLHWLSVPEAAPSGQADASARR